MFFFVQTHLAKKLANVVSQELIATSYLKLQINDGNFKGMWRVHDKTSSF